MTFRSFTITPAFQERYGYPALTKARKAKILGLNGARVYGITPRTDTCEFTRPELQAIRRKLGRRHGTHGPRNAAEVNALLEHHRGWPG